MSIEKLTPELAKVQATVDEWTAKADTARTEAETLDRSSGAEILTNPDAAEDITIKVEAAKRRARAYDSAADEARAKVRAVYIKHMEAEATALEKTVQAKTRELNKHRSQVEALLDKLESLDGVRYKPHLGHPAYVKGEVLHEADDAPEQTKTTGLEEYLGGAEVQARKVRFVLEHGRLPRHGDEPSILPVGEAHLLIGIDTPPVTRAALDAGVL